jgi:Na+-transporting NADH:ubiquinone oxidoreductase subunit A
MSIGIKVKKGLDLHLEGAVANPRQVETKTSATVAIIPDDFAGITPKMEVAEGDAVVAGQPLFHDKAHSAIKVVSPAAGTVKAVVRGERRKILSVIVAVESEASATFATEGVLTDAAKARELLLNSGLWAMTTQRPYAVVPADNAELRDIFVTGFDSAPLAESAGEFSAEQTKQLEAGVKLLGLLTSGKVYVSRRAAQAMPDIKGAEMVDVEGPHPAGNAGTVIAAIHPINKGETVMCLDLATLLRIGATALTGKLPCHTTVALTGSEVKQPKMLNCLIGSEIASLIAGELNETGNHKRIISGDVLTGIAVSTDGYLRNPYQQITVIPEGDDVDEFMGWASISPKKMSQSRSFPGHFLCKKLFRPDARVLGGRRAMIMSGEYDKVMPMDILPEYLIKAILSRDIDRMEQLGIYEVAPEDFALAEYVDTSKLELQKIVREGLDYLRKELE